MFQPHVSPCIFILQWHGIKTEISPLPSTLGQLEAKGTSVLFHSHPETVFHLRGFWIRLLDLVNAENQITASIVDQASQPWEQWVSTPDLHTQKHRLKSINRLAVNMVHTLHPSWEEKKVETCHSHFQLRHFNNFQDLGALLPYMELRSPGDNAHVPTLP